VQKLADEIRPRFESGGVKVEQVDTYAPGEFGKTIPADTAVSDIEGRVSRRDAKSTLALSQSAL